MILCTLYVQKEGYGKGNGKGNGRKGEILVLNWFGSNFTLYFFAHINL